jgi:hypothetical protein
MALSYLSMIVSSRQRLLKALTQTPNPNTSPFCIRLSTLYNRDQLYILSSLNTHENVRRGSTPEGLVPFHQARDSNRQRYRDKMEMPQYLGCLDTTCFEFFNSLQSALSHGRSHGFCTETKGKVIFTDAYRVESD